MDTYQISLNGSFWRNRSFFFFLSLILLAALVSCSHVPRIKKSVTDDVENVFKQCQRIFPGSSRHFLHSIEVTLPGNKKTVMLGITQIFPNDQSIRATMITLEGMVLFDVFYDGTMIVHRALPPFDSEHFAHGLLDDIGLIFFQPQSPITETGKIHSGDVICRYHFPKNIIIDVTLLPDNNATLKKYVNHRLHRMVHFYEKIYQASSDTYQKITLIAHGPESYRIDLDLLKTEPLKESLH